jgi:hypothetical protein
MNLKIKILNSELIIKNEFELDEIVRIHGTIGDMVEAHINQTETNTIKIVRKYTMVETLGIEIVSEDEYFKNYQLDKSYYKNEYGDSIDYLKDNYDEFEITKEDYENEIKHGLKGNYVFTSLNYSDFLKDFDFQYFNSFFDQIIINQVSNEFLMDIENFILNNNKAKGKILLQNCLSDLIISNKFLEDFKNLDKSNQIQKKICEYFLYYNYIIKISLINYYQLIFPKLIKYFSTNETSKTNKILKDLLNACYKTQGNYIFQKDTDENKRTKQILDLLDSNKDYKIENQNPTGMSSTGKKIGSCDGLIIDNQTNDEYLVEALNLGTFSKEYLISHINKLEFNYDFKGLATKFILVYCNLKENTFDDFVSKYKNFIVNEMNFYYQKSEIKEEIVEFNKFSESRVFQSSHIREGKNVFLYHILLKFKDISIQ